MRAVQRQAPKRDNQNWADFLLPLFVGLIDKPSFEFREQSVKVRITMSQRLDSFDTIAAIGMIAAVV